MHNANRNYISIIMLANDENLLKPIVICLNIETSQHEVRKNIDGFIIKLITFFIRHFMFIFLS